MKSIGMLLAITLFVATAPCFAHAQDASATCPAVLSQDPAPSGGDAPGGGGISGVGGGGGGELGFAVWQYINPIYTDTFPQLVRLKTLGDGNVIGCVYDHHFGQTKTPKLVTTMACTGGQTITWPWTAQLRVKCSGTLGDSHLDFEATYLRPELIASMIRTGPDGSQNTEAYLIGH